MARKKIGVRPLLGPYTSADARAVVEELGAYGSYPRPATDGWITDLFTKAAAKIGAPVQDSVKSILLLLECFLQITGLRFVRGDWAKNRVTLELFLGAVYSTKFFAATLYTRHRKARATLRILAASDLSAPDSWVSAAFPSVRSTSPTLEEFRCRFECLILDKERVAYWMNWASTNSTGTTTWFDLAGVYDTFGREYTREFYLACASYHALIGRAAIPLRTELPSYMVMNSELALSARSDHNASQEFWKGLIRYLLQTRTTGSAVTTIIAAWRSRVPKFLKALDKSGIFVEPVGGLPLPPAHFVPPSDTHVRRIGGSLLRFKSVTPFSTESFTDEEAIRQKTQEVSSDLDVIARWAEAKANQVWVAYKNRLALAMIGVPVTLRHHGALDSPKMRMEDREKLENRAATLRKYGLVANYDYLNNKGPSQRELFGRKRGDMASQLGMPTLTAIFPFMTILVIRHPEITDSFLATLELYDKYNSRVGFGTNQAGYFLRGFKRRRGKEKAQQTIQITSESARMVLRVLCITGICRRFLKSRGDDAYRYMFLSTGGGFGYPTKFGAVTHKISTKRNQSQQFIRELQELTLCSLEQASKIAANFSLTKLRAQVVVSNYLERQDTAEVARALGHVRFNYKLVVRYVPQPLMVFFMERWVRIHQTRFIVEALKNSPYRLEASGFESAAELERFMKNHCLRVDDADNRFPGQSVERTEQMSGSTTLIGIDESVMTILCSIELSKKAHLTRSLRPAAELWAEASSPIIEHIEAIKETRPDLFAYLDRGRSAASVSLVEGVLYE